MNDDVEMNCPSCDKRLSIPAMYRGQSGKCQYCNGPVYVPMLTATPEKATLVASLMRPVVAVGKINIPRTKPFILDRNRHPDPDPNHALLLAQRAHTRALNQNFGCLLALLLVLFCPIWIPMLLIFLGSLLAFL